MRSHPERNNRLNDVRANLDLSRRARFCVSILQRAHTEEGPQFLVGRVFAGEQTPTCRVEDEANLLAVSGKKVMIRNLIKGEAYLTLNRERKIHGENDGIQCKQSSGVLI